MKEGYVPPEDIGKFVCSAEQRHRAAAQIVPGTTRLRNPNAGFKKKYFLIFKVKIKHEKPKPMLSTMRLQPPEALPSYQLRNNQKVHFKVSIQIQI